MTAAKNQESADYEVFGPYEVYERLGVGGMATVHRAKERGIEGFERIVALKRLLPHLAEDESFVRSFVREAKLASLLQHPNIVQLYELGRVGSVYFISMEYIEGNDVRCILRQARRLTGPPPLGVLIALLSQLCDALDYAHRRTDQSGEPLGLVHRDVSPSNLLVTNAGHVKIIDFGIAKAQSQQLRTQTGRVKGKLAYMAPEAIRGHELDARSDIFAAGVIAHELITARPLFASKNEYDTLVRVQRSEVEPPSRHNPGCPPELDAIVLKALARDPDKRWQSASELSSTLADLCVHYHASATAYDVAEWLEWAFATERAAGREHGRPSSQNESQSPVTRTRQPTAPQRAFARASSRSGVVSRASTASDSGSDKHTAPLRMTTRDDEAAEFAWGQAEERAEPVLLDEVPDVSVTSMPAQSASRTDALAAAHDALPEATLDREFGAGIVAEARRRRRAATWLTVLVMLAAGGGAAYVIKPWRAPPPPAAPRTATLKLVIEPHDATIDVLGYGRHQGSPLTLEVAAPGVYRVQVSHAGYQSYVTELEVEGGAKNVVRVALVEAAAGHAAAQVVVRSMPEGQRVFLDGMEQPGRTPVSLEVAPGAHVLAIQDDAGRELWSHELEAAANTQYELMPALYGLMPALHAPDELIGGEDRPRMRQRRLAGSATGGLIPQPVTRTAQARMPQAAEPATHTGTQGAAPSSPDKAGAASLDAVAKAGTAQGAHATAEPEPAWASKQADRATRADKPTRAETPAPPRPAAPRAPITVPPTAVKKRSGSLPSIPGTRDSVPRLASAKLCIDPTGGVTSAEVLTDMPARAASTLRRALEGWRYQPYVRRGEAVAACFAVNFKIDVNR